MVQENLIFDIGMHVGDDADFYLKKGFHVIAVEANPLLVTSCRKRFKSQIDAGLLVIEEGAIAEASGSVPFFINEEKDDWSSTLRQVASRENMPVREIYVDALRLDDLICKYGVPYYLKIDIEGGDKVALQQMFRVPERPKYCSVEAHELIYLLRMFDLGYTRFKVVNQGNYWWFRCPNPPLEGLHVDHTFSIHSSGSFGEEAVGRWVSLEEAALIYLELKKLAAENEKLVYQWCDFHAG